MEDQAECMLVIIGATPEGKKELLGFQVGLRESAQSWRELLVDIKSRGLSAAPEIAVGDGALGFWKALDEIFPTTRHQRCWVHKVKNVLNHFPKPMAVTVKSDLNDISHAETRAEASIAMDLFSEKYGVKFEKAVRCLIKNRDVLLAFYDFPAEHWVHLRTSNPPSRTCLHALPVDDRKCVCNDQTQNRQDQRGAVPKDRKADGLYAHSGGLEKMVAIERKKSVAKNHSGHKVQ